MGDQDVWYGRKKPENWVMPIQLYAAYYDPIFFSRMPDPPYRKEYIGISKMTSLMKPYSNCPGAARHSGSRGNRIEEDVIQTVKESILDICDGMNPIKGLYNRKQMILIG